MIALQYRNPYFLFFLLTIILVPMMKANAQAFTRQEFKDSVQNLPYFTIHKDNYFITGVPTNTSVTSNSANAKYQISLNK